MPVDASPVPLVPPILQVPPLLEVHSIYAGYRDSDILRGISLHVNPSEIVCMIGPNGAGKSTVLKAIYGLVKVRTGQVWFDGREVTHVETRELLQAGIALVPQRRSLFPQMTVRENLELGMYLRWDQRLIQQQIRYVLDFFPDLAERAGEKAGRLSGGAQRMLEIGRGLMLKPRLALIDEPSAGLSPRVTERMYRDLLTMNRETGLTVLMVEQNARQALQISQRGYVLELGKNTYTGTGQELLGNPRVREAFLGGLKVSTL